MLSRHEHGNGLEVDLSSRPPPILSSSRWLFPLLILPHLPGHRALVIWSSTRANMHIGGRGAQPVGMAGALQAFSSYILLLVHPQTWMCPRFFLELVSFSLPHSHGRLGSIIVVFVVFVGVGAQLLGDRLIDFLHSRRLDVRPTIDGIYLATTRETDLCGGVLMGRGITREATLPPQLLNQPQKKRLFVLLDFFYAHAFSTHLVRCWLQAPAFLSIEILIGGSLLSCGFHSFPPPPPPSLSISLQVPVAHQQQSLIFSSFSSPPPLLLHNLSVDYVCCFVRGDLRALRVSGKGFI